MENKQPTKEEFGPSLDQGRRLHLVCQELEKLKDQLLDGPAIVSSSQVAGAIKQILGL